MDPGFGVRGVAFSHIALPVDRFDTDAKVGAWYDALLKRLKSAPGVEAAGLASVPPLTGGGDTAVHREGHAQG